MATRSKTNLMSEGDVRFNIQPWMLWDGHNREVYTLCGCCSSNQYRQKMELDSGMMMRVAVVMMMLMSTLTPLLWLTKRRHLIDPFHLQLENESFAAYEGLSPRSLRGRF